MQNIYKQAVDVIKKSNNIVFFGGAGVSTECGIPDFRSKNGLYSREYKYKYNPETILSHSFLNSHPDVFYDYLRENLMYYNVKPNKGHIALAKLEEVQKLKAVITQNIDGLHQMAGSKKVLELHGTMSRFYCSKCNKEYSPEYIEESKGVPKCSCNGIIRPDVVLYEESLDNDVIYESLNYISNADTLIVAGTSLAVYPAAGFLEYFKGQNVIFINKDSTPYDSMANIIINKPFAVTMTNIMMELNL